MPTILRVTAKTQKGFHRAGVRWPGREVRVPADRFTAEQIKALQNEPMLVVVEEDEPEMKPAERPEKDPAKEQEKSKAKAEKA